MDIKKLIKRFDDLTIKRNTCLHPSFVKKNCIVCGREANDENTWASYTYDTSVPFKYIDKDLRYSRLEIARLKDQNTKNMLSQKKLHLVLDLDHTLIHAISTEEYERYLLKSKDDVPIIGKTYVDSLAMVTKISPFVPEFLKEASTMFDMHVYTMAGRNYAKAMTRLLDPDEVYFGSRIVSKEDCTRPGSKGLDVILGNENATLILDDTKDVWPDHKENLILIEKYCYFTPRSGRGKIIYLQNKKTDDSKEDRALRSVLEKLKKVHTRFFEKHNQRKHDQRTISEIDVRNILKSVLKGVV